MTPITVNRSDISVVETRELASLPLGDPPQLVRIHWVAKLSGRLSTGERVELSRSASSFADALADLEHEVQENGWVIE